MRLSLRRMMRPALLAGAAIVCMPGTVLAADECGDPSANGAAADTFACSAGPYAGIDYSTTTNGNLQIQLPDGVTVTTNGIIISGKAGELISLITTTTVPDSGDISVTNAAGTAINVSGMSALVSIDLRTSDTGDTPAVISGTIGINARNTVGATEVYMGAGTVTATNGNGINVEGATGAVVSIIGTTINASGYAVIADASGGNASVVAGGNSTGGGGLAAVAGGAGNASVELQLGSNAAGNDGFSYGAFAQATGTGTATLNLLGNVNDGGAGVFSSAGTASLIGTGAITMLGVFDAVEMATVAGAINVDHTGNITSNSADGIDTFTDTGATTIVLGGTVQAGDNAIEASSNSGSISITLNGSALATNGDGVNIVTPGAISLTVNGLARGGDFGIDITNGAATVVVTGSVEGGNGAIRFDQGGGGFADRLELRQGFAITGLVLAGAGNDTLAFAGAGAASFDLNAIDTGGNTKRYRGFENFVVESAKWSFSGATAASFTVNAGATLGGNGTFGGLVIGAGATLAPGNSIGTVTVNGNLAFAAGSTYAVEVSSTDADRTNVTGTANLSGATVVTSYAPGQYVARGYVILNATGGLGGTTFAGLTGLTASGILSQRLQYDANNVYLIIDVAPLAGLTDNQRAVANAFAGYLNSNGNIPAAFLGLTAEQLTQAGGQISTAAVGAGIDSATQFLGQISDPAITGGGASAPIGDASNAYAPLAYSAEPANLSSPGALAALGAEVPASSDAANAALAMSSAHAADPVDVAMAKRWAMWGSVYGSVGRIGGNAVVGSTELTARNWGVASGFERSFGNSRLGLSLGGAGSTFSLSGGLGSGSAGIFNAGIYGSHSFGNAYVSGALGYGWNNVRTTRNVPGDTLTANFNAHTLAGRLETGYRFGSTSAVTPYVALQGGNYFLPAHTETSALGGPFALNYARQSEAFLRSELGARFEHSMPTSTGSLKFSARAAWAYNAINDRAVTAAFAALPGQTFTVNGARLARSAALLDLGMEANFDSGLSAKINFNGEFSRNVSAYGASAKLIYRW